MREEGTARRTRLRSDVETARRGRPARVSWLQGAGLLWMVGGCGLIVLDPELTDRRPNECLGRADLVSSDTSEEV